jgi:dienelactone hydrolase
MKKLFLLSFLSCLLWIAPEVQAQKLSSGPQVMTFFSNADDSEQPYGLYIPPNYNPEKKYPLVIMLHGAGSNHRLALRRVFGKSNATGETDVEASKYFPPFKNVNYIVATPFARGTAGYQGIPENDVYDVVDDVKKRLNVDENMVYLTGLSMGGGGTLWIGLSRPDVWAAIAPVCPAPPRGAEDLAGNALNYPVHIFQGEADPAVKAEGVRKWYSNFKSQGVNVTYTEYPGVLHDSWVNAYEGGYIFDWFRNFKRNLHPERVRFATKNYKYSKAYWVHLDAFTPGTLAKIDARFKDYNKLDIVTSDLDAFTLNIAGHPDFKANNPLEVVIDGKKVKATNSPEISFTRQNGVWIQQKYEASSIAKKPGAEGPIFAAFSNRHIYVYGTKDNPNAEELRLRREIAVQAANWSQYRGEFLGRMMFFPRVLSDKEVRPSDIESSNLILFGTKETNNLISEYSEKLPIHLNADATKDHGLFYVFPINEKYVAINSGLPWWTSNAASGFSFIQPIHSQLTEFKDYVLFKESNKNLISEGYFANNWTILTSEQQKMKDSGVVQLFKPIASKD